MRCDEIRPRLDVYIDGELAEAERLVLRDHLVGCPECSSEATALERLREGIRQSAPIYHAPAKLSSMIRFALRQLTRVRPARMIGRDQNPQVPRRRLRVGLAERVDDACGILAEALRRALAEPGLVDRQLLRRGAIV